MGFPATFPSTLGGVSTWDGVSAAIRGWVRNATGYDDAHVIWAAQNGGRPTDSDYVSIAIDGPYPDGQAETRYVPVEGTPTAGQEMAEVVTQNQYLEIKLQAFTLKTIGDLSARTKLEKVQIALWLESTRASFRAANMAPVEAQKVISVPEVFQTKFEGRASLLCRFGTRGLAVSFLTFIESGGVTASLTDSSIGDTFNVPL